MPRSTQVYKFSSKRKSKYAQSVARKQAKIDRTAGEKFSLRKAIKSSGNKTTTILERSQYYGTLSQTDGTTASMFFRLSDIPNYTDFTSLYDQYRIVGIKVTLVNCAPVNTNAFNVTTGLFNPYTEGALISAVDLDDAGAATVNQILEHDSCIIHGNGRKFTREFIPAVAQATYQSAGFTGYGSKQNMWIDTNSPAVEHYGLKIGVRNPGSALSSSVYQLFVTYVLEFKLPY